MALPIHNQVHAKLDHFLITNKIPHILFHGSSGSGKRTIVDGFIKKIYQGDKAKIKSNVMFVNCAHGKGIKFIREDLKFFAKTNIQSNNGIIFKTIVLMNADFLTIDAQSALRRSIELFSYNTRFFIIVENKNKMLNPILSRFCEIYVPEFIDNGVFRNLHNFFIERAFPAEDPSWLRDKMDALMELDLTTVDHTMLVDLSTALYENGNSCMDLMEWVRGVTHFSTLEKATASMCFDKIKAEFRNEKLLFLYMLDILLFRSKKGLECIPDM